MKPKHQRLCFLVVAIAMIVGATALILTRFNDSIVFFYSPSDIVSKKPAVGQHMRIGGLVEAGSLVRTSAQDITFVTTDYAHTLKVHYAGELPALFREGQGVVAEGVLEVDGSFTASTILAKHDEKYMPPEVARAIKDSGQWKGGAMPNGASKETSQP
jgi:cytochrome c-type biogenesis protein CcmE